MGEMYPVVTPYLSTGTLGGWVEGSDLLLCILSGWMECLISSFLNFGANKYVQYNPADRLLISYIKFDRLALYLLPFYNTHILYMV